MRPSRAHSRTRGVACGAITRTVAPDASRLSIFPSPTGPAPTIRIRRPSSFTNMGNKLIAFLASKPNQKSNRLIFRSTGFSLWNFVFARTKTHRLKPVLLRGVQPAFFFREAGPAARARIFSRLHLARALHAADARVILFMQRIV